MRDLFIRSDIELAPKNYSCNLHATILWHTSCRKHFWEPALEPALQFICFTFAELYKISLFQNADVPKLPMLSMSFEGVFYK